MKMPTRRNPEGSWFRRYAQENDLKAAVQFGQASPLAPMLGDVQDGIEYLQVRQADIASLSRQAVLDLLKLSSCDLHAPNVARTRDARN